MYADNLHGKTDGNYEKKEMSFYIEENVYGAEFRGDFNDSNSSTIQYQGKEVVKAVGRKLRVSDVLNHVCYRYNFCDFVQGRKEYYLLGNDVLIFMHDTEMFRQEIDKYDLNGLIRGLQNSEQDFMIVRRVQ